MNIESYAMEVRPSRFEGIGYGKQNTGLWRVIDLQTGNTVGPQYPTMAELLADLARYVVDAGWSN